MRCSLSILLLFAFIAPLAPALGQEAEKTVRVPAAEGVRVPYLLTDTKHVMVRAKINGKGPFNFIIDTGAPALFVGTEAAKKLDVKAGKNGWANFERFELEGGVMLKDAKGRVEDPFQLTGMNKMNLPGVRYDGMIGYTVLARYRIRFDFTKSHLVFTKLDWDPPPPVGLADLGKGAPPPEVQGMSGLVGLATMFVGRRPDAELIYRGFLGVELEEKKDQAKLVVKKVYANSPAAEAGLREGDELTRFQDSTVASLAELHKLTTKHASKEKLELEVRRGEKTERITVSPIRGL
jgi:hypothetical protein